MEFDKDDDPVNTLSNVDGNYSKKEKTSNGGVKIVTYDSNGRIVNKEVKSSSNNSTEYDSIEQENRGKNKNKSNKKKQNFVERYLENNSNKKVIRDLSIAGMITLAIEIGGIYYLSLQDYTKSENYQVKINQSSVQLSSSDTKLEENPYTTDNISEKLKQHLPQESYEEGKERKYHITSTFPPIKYRFGIEQRRYQIQCTSSGFDCSIKADYPNGSRKVFEETSQGNELKLENIIAGLASAVSESMCLSGGYEGMLHNIPPEYFNSNKEEVKIELEHEKLSEKYDFIQDLKKINSKNCK